MTSAPPRKAMGVETDIQPIEIPGNAKIIPSDLMVLNQIAGVEMVQGEEDGKS